MLAGNRDLAIGIVDEGEREVLAGLRPLDILVDRPIQNLEKGAGIIEAALMQRAADRLHHQHENAAFNAMARHVADADLDAARVWSTS